MAKYLVIVESPAKVKTVKKYLGANYEVAASMGHVRDLPKSRLGIDVEHDFEPKYITIRGKGELLAKLRKSAKKADKRISSDFAFKAATGEKLVMKSSGLQKRSYCYSLDCAIQILTALLKGEKGQAYNIGHDEITTIRQMAKIYAEAGNVKLIIADPTENELKAFNPMNNSSLNNNRIKQLGYRDSFTVEEGLKHTVYILKELMG